jgi:hypothetical protein
MPQNAFIMRDPLAPDDPCAWLVSPPVVNIYTNDQVIVWKLMAGSGSGIDWDSSKNPPIVFDTDWKGSTPEPIPGSGTPTLYTATGPGAASPADASSYTYQIWISVPGCGTIQVGKTSQMMIDPDVWNQPQP